MIKIALKPAEFKYTEKDWAYTYTTRRAVSNSMDVHGCQFNLKPTVELAVFFDSAIQERVKTGPIYIVDIEKYKKL
jgi:hypothetical protein